MASNDNSGQEQVSATRSSEPDAHGQAALLLAESETRALTVVQAIAVVEVAAEVKVEVAEEAHESSARMQQSLNLLAAIGRTFKVDDQP